MTDLSQFRIPTGVRAWIEDVVVDESARGQGVGEALTDAALQVAAARLLKIIDQGSVLHEPRDLLLIKA